MKAKSIIGVALLALIWHACNPSNNKSDDMKQPTKTELYTFELNSNVIRRKVSFKNRYGITLVGDLYTPKNQENKPLAAIAISGPFGAVKEQSSGLYANELARRGFITLAFDASYTGESSGEPRHIASPDINTEDFSAAADYLGIQPNIDRNKIGVLGICGFGGFALNAAAIDKRIKAVAVTSMYDMSRVNAKGYFDATTKDERQRQLIQIGEQRWKDAAAGKTSYGENGLENLPDVTAAFVKEYAAYYKTDRGFHANSINSNASWALTNTVSFMNMPIMTYIKEISPRPMLLIAGEKAHSRYFSEDAYVAAEEPKELLIIPNAVHVDLYDKLDIIPFEKLSEFFHENLTR